MGGENVTNESYKSILPQLIEKWLKGKTRVLGNSTEAGLEIICSLVLKTKALDPPASS
jgi:hypothetical protein